MSDSGAKLILWTAAAALLVALVAVPQPVDPWEMPSLVLDRKAVARQVAKTKSLAATFETTEQTQRLERHFIEHGLAEASGDYDKVDYDTRQAHIHHAVRRLVEAGGPTALSAMRATAVNEAVALLERRDALDERERGALGAFVETLERYGALYDGELIAPPLTVRTLYKSGWNRIHRLPATSGFSDIEQQAYWGWLALHGWGAPLDKRTEALSGYRNAGGAHADEAAALFALLEGKPATAAAALETLDAQQHRLRLRNLALGALAAARAQAR